MARVSLIALFALLVVLPAATTSRNLPETAVVDTKTPAAVDQKNFVAFGRVGGVAGVVAGVGEDIGAIGYTTEDVLGDLGGGGVGSDELAVTGGVGRLGVIGGAGGGLGGLGGGAGGIRP